MMLYLWIVLQIVLESLPVSSSGHVALMQKYVAKLDNLPLLNNQLWIVDYLLHGPMIIILLLFFFKIWWQIILQIPFSLKRLKQLVIVQSSLEEKSRSGCIQNERKEYKKNIKILWHRIVRVMIFCFIADGITIFFWLFNLIPVISLTTGFMITATLLYLTRYCKERFHVFDMNYIYAILLGLGQSFSFLPGVSRFATTYAVGRFCGYSGRVSFAVSFLIQFPLLIAAFFKGFVAMRKHLEFTRNFFDFKVLFVILAASIISYVLLWYIDSVVKKNKLWQFSWYMLVPIVLTLFV